MYYIIDADLIQSNRMYVLTLYSLIDDGNNVLKLLTLHVHQKQQTNTLNIKHNQTKHNHNQIKHKNKK